MKLYQTCHFLSHKTFKLSTLSLKMMKFSVFLAALFSTCSAGANYYMYATTWDTTHAGTDSDIYVRIHGMRGTTSWYLCDLSLDDFTRGDTDYYQFYRNEDVGDIMCVEFHTGGEDMLLIHRVQIGSYSSGWHYIYNKRGQWLSRDSSEGVTQDKWCENDCAHDLPIRLGYWSLARTDFNLGAATISPLSPTVVDTHTMDATTSPQDIETEYFASVTAHDSMTFSKTGGVLVSGVSFAANPVEVANSAAVVDAATSLQFQYSVPLQRSNIKSSWFGCRAPAGKKVQCTAEMVKMQVRVPFTQTWQRGSCTWVVSGEFNRVWDSKLEQKIVEV